MANCFHDLDINYKSEVKKNVLMTVSLELLPRLGGVPASGENGSLCLLPSFVWGAGKDGKSLEDAVGVKINKS